MWASAPGITRLVYYIYSNCTFTVPSQNRRTAEPQNRRTADPDLRFCEGTVKVQLLYIVNTIFSLIESIWNWNYWSLIYLFYCESQLPVDPTKEAKLKQRGLWVTIEKIICEWVPPASLGWYTIYIVTALSRYLRRTAEPQNRRTAEPQNNHSTTR